MNLDGGMGSRTRTRSKYGVEIGALVYTGGLFPVTGYYQYVEHAEPLAETCFVSRQAMHGMLFERGDKVPDLAACGHKVIWKLVAIY